MLHRMSAPPPKKKLEQQNFEWISLLTICLKKNNTICLKKKSTILFLVGEPDPLKKNLNFLENGRCQDRGYQKMQSRGPFDDKTKT